MKSTVEKRKPNGIVDYIALALTTCGVGYVPGAPGTYGSVVGVLIYIIVTLIEAQIAVNYYVSKHPEFLSLDLRGVLNATYANALIWGVNGILLLCLCLLGIWASGRTVPIFGRKDPSEAVVDEVMGQLITFCFIPFGLSWPFLLVGFLLFRLFDIWKPYPVHTLEMLPGGLGVCADDIVAGVYAGICLALIYAVSLSF